VDSEPLVYASQISYREDDQQVLGADLVASLNQNFPEAQVTMIGRNGMLVDDENDCQNAGVRSGRRSCGGNPSCACMRAT
jgi:hypothetical protein